MNPSQIFNSACCHLFRIDAPNCLYVRIGFYCVEIENLIDQIRNFSLSFFLSTLWSPQTCFRLTMFVPTIDWPMDFWFENPLIDWMAFRHSTKFLIRKIFNRFQVISKNPKRAKSNVTIFSACALRWTATFNLSIGVKC